MRITVPQLCPRIGISSTFAAGPRSELVEARPLIFSTRFHDEKAGWSLCYASAGKLNSSSRTVVSCRRHAGRISLIVGEGSGAYRNIVVCRRRALEMLTNVVMLN
jgi:hypothetical protein